MKMATHYHGTVVSVLPERVAALKEETFSDWPGLFVLILV